jgi:hypothetical protein
MPCAFTSSGLWASAPATFSNHPLFRSGLLLQAAASLLGVLLLVHYYYMLYNKELHYACIAHHEWHVRIYILHGSMQERGCIIATLSLSFPLEIKMGGGNWTCLALYS